MNLAQSVEEAVEKAAEAHPSLAAFLPLTRQNGMYVYYAARSCGELSLSHAIAGALIGSEQRVQTALAHFRHRK